AVDLYCGLGGWAEGFLAEGYSVVGFDIERHDYGTGGYPGQLVIQDVLTLHGSQFKDAAVIVASPPCQKYSYMAMPWKRAKDLAHWYRKSYGTIKQLNALFDACFRIQREANEATGYICQTCGATDESRTVMVRPAGYGHYDDLPEYEWCPDCFYKSKRYIPLIVENVRGAQPWVGKARWNFGSYYLWGDVPALMPKPALAQKFNPDGTEHGTGSWFKSADSKNRGARDGLKVPSFRFDGSGKSFQTASVKAYGGSFGWDESPLRSGNSKSKARKAASAQIAKIPFPLSQHIAQVYKPPMHSVRGTAA